MSKQIRTTLNATKALVINQYFFGGFYNGEMIHAKEDIDHHWDNASIEMISHTGYNANKPNTKTARKLIINGIEFVEVFPTIFRTNPTRVNREMSDFTYNYKTEDFQ